MIITKKYLRNDPPTNLAFCGLSTNVDTLPMSAVSRNDGDLGDFVPRYEYNRLKALYDASIANCEKLSRQVNSCKSVEQSRNELAETDKNNLLKTLECLQCKIRRDVPVEKQATYALLLQKLAAHFSTSSAEVSRPSQKLEVWTA